MHDYAMLQHGDRVLLGVSGGVDSSVLAWVLKSWLAKAPIEYTLKAVYIDNGFWKPEFGGQSPHNESLNLSKSSAVAPEWPPPCGMM